MMKKVIYSEYEGKYDESIKERLEKDPGSVDVEMMRANLYGYTYTKDYADGEIADELSMDYWEEHHEEMELDNLNFEGRWSWIISTLRILKCRIILIPCWRIWMTVLILMSRLRRS